MVVQVVVDADEATVETVRLVVVEFHDDVLGPCRVDDAGRRDRFWRHRQRDRLQRVAAEQNRLFISEPEQPS